MTKSGKCAPGTAAFRWWRIAAPRPLSFCRTCTCTSCPWGSVALGKSQLLAPPTLTVIIQVCLCVNCFHRNLGITCVPMLNNRSLANTPLPVAHWVQPASPEAPRIQCGDSPAKSEQQVYTAVLLVSPLPPRHYPLVIFMPLPRPLPWVLPSLSLMSSSRPRPLPWLSFLSWPSSWASVLPSVSPLSSCRPRSCPWVILLPWPSSWASVLPSWLPLSASRLWPMRPAASDHGCQQEMCVCVLPQVPSVLQRILSLMSCEPACAREPRSAPAVGPAGGMSQHHHHPLAVG